MDIGLTTDALQGQALQDTMKRLDRMYEIIVGNGDPEKGLAAQVMLVKRDLEYLKKGMHENELSRTAQITELRTMILEDRLSRVKQNEKQGDRWLEAVFSVGQSLVAAAIGATVALFVTGKIHF